MILVQVIASRLPSECDWRRGPRIKVPDGEVTRLRFVRSAKEDSETTDIVTVRWADIGGIAVDAGPGTRWAYEKELKGGATEIVGDASLFDDETFATGEPRQWH